MREVTEAVIIRDRAASDVDNQIRDLTVHLNPGRQETEALMARSVDGNLRGLVWDSGERVGSLVVWDAYVADHATVIDLLAEHGYGHPWARFSMSRAEFQAGKIATYVDHGIDTGGWAALPQQHMVRMIGKTPLFAPG